MLQLGLHRPPKIKHRSVGKHLCSGNCSGWLIISPSPVRFLPLPLTFSMPPPLLLPPSLQAWCVSSGPRVALSLFVTRLGFFGPLPPEPSAATSWESPVSGSAHTHTHIHPTPTFTPHPHPPHTHPTPQRLFISVWRWSPQHTTNRRLSRLPSHFLFYLFIVYCNSRGLPLPVICQCLQSKPFHSQRGRHILCWFTIHGNVTSCVGWRSMGTSHPVVTHPLCTSQSL